MGMPPTASRSIAVTPVGVAAARIRLPMPIQKLAAKRLCIPTKSEAAYVASRARIAGFAYYRVRLDQKKVAHLPPLQTTLLAPDPKDFTSTILELVGQLAIEYPLTSAAPDPPKRRKRARSRRLLRLPFHTKGVGRLFQPSTVCSNQSISSCAFLGC